jgi:uncharacterized protein (TIGR03435 family)
LAKLAPMKNVIRVASFLFLACVGFPQPAENPTFEVASVKPMPPPDPHTPQFFLPPRGGPGTHDPTLITWNNARLRDIVMTAYDIQTFQLIAPDWLVGARYEIVARVPANATKEQVRSMWQNLLRDRFGLKLHKEEKELRVSILTVAKSGSKLKPTADPQAEPFTPTPGPAKFDQNGSIEMNGTGAILMITPQNGVMTARMFVRGLSIAEIATKFGQSVRHTVLDRTGLTGKYDFTLEFIPDMSGVPPPPAGLLPPPGVPPTPSVPNADQPGSNLASAVEEQLGLKLTSGKEKLDVIVLDHIEKLPTEN